MIRFKLASILLLVLGLTLTQFAGDVLAQEEETTAGLEELLFMEVPVVTTASLSEQSLDRVPGSMTVITAEEIKAHGLVGLADIYDVYVGGHMNYITGDSVPYIRGEIYTKFMIDGHPVNNVFSRAHMCYDYYPLENIKQIEIVRGPGSALWGGDAICGVINVITKKEARTTFSATYGEHERYDGYLFHASDPDQDLSFRIGYDFMKEMGEDITRQSGFLTDYLGSVGTSPEVSLAPVRENNYRENHGGEFAIKYRNFEFKFGHRDSKQVWVGGVSNTQNPRGAWVLERQTRVEMEYLHELSDTSNLNFYASFDRDFQNYKGSWMPPGFHFWRIGPYATPDLGDPFLYAGVYTFRHDAGSGYYYLDINNDGMAEYWPDGGKFDSDCLGLRYNFDTRYQTQIQNHDLTLGFHYRRDQIIEVGSMRNYNFPYRVPYRYWHKDSEKTAVLNLSPVWMIGDGHKENIFAVYLQDIWQINDDLTAVIGARWDDYEMAGEVVSPRIALIWDDAFDTGQIAKFSYSEAFLTPANSSVRYQNALNVVPNPNAGHSIMESYEISVQNPYESRVHYSLLYFESEHNYTSPVRVNTWRGVELDATWRVNDVLNLWGNYAHALGYRETTNEGLAGVRHLGNIGLTWAVTPDLNFSPSVRFVGEFASGISTLYTAEAPNAPNYILTNLAIVYTGIPQAEVSIIGRNILDEDYFSYASTARLSPPGGFSDHLAMPGRQMLFKVTYNF